MRKHKLNKMSLAALGIALAVIIGGVAMLTGIWVGCTATNVPVVESPEGNGGANGSGTTGGGAVVKMNPWPSGTGALRSVAGIAPGDHYQTLPLMNYAQLILMEDSEAGDGTISAFDAQVYRDGVSDHLSVNVEVGKAYHVLVLIGHTNNEGSPNNYDKNDPQNYTNQPTLLQSGYTKITATAEPMELKIPVASLVIDMDFFKGTTPVSFPAVGQPLALDKSAAYTAKVAVKTAGQNGEVTGDGLWPLKLADRETRVGQTWANGKASFSKPVSAGGYVQGTSLDSVKVYLGNWANATIGFFMQGGVLKTASDDNSPARENNGNVTTGSAEYQFTTGSADADGKFYFHLEYVPYNVTQPSGWTGKPGMDKIGGQMPIWIIRNGANDWAQNANTNFSQGKIQVGNSGNGFNGNGAIPIKVGAGNGGDYDFDGTGGGSGGGGSGGDTGSFGISLYRQSTSDLNQTYTFSGAAQGYAPVTPLTVTAANTGSRPLSGLAISLGGTQPSAFQVSSSSISSLAVGAASQFTVNPAAGLSAGTYNASVTVGNTNAAASFNVSFTVTSSQGSAVTVGVTPSDIDVIKGDTQQFTAHVTGITNTAVTWSINGTPGTGTAIDGNGLLTVASTEVNTSLVIRAASIVDPSSFGEASVTVLSPGNIIPGTPW